MSIFCGRGSLFASYPIACNMSPLGSRRGPALRASIRRRPEGGTTGGLARCVGFGPKGKSYSSELASAEHQGATPFRRPLWTQLSPGAKIVERGAIFQHKGHAMLSYLEDALQVASKMAPRQNLTPTWPHLGPQDRPGIPPRSPNRPPSGPRRLHEASKRPPGDLQETPKRSQETPTS